MTNRFFGRRGGLFPGAGGGPNAAGNGGQRGTEEWIDLTKGQGEDFVLHGLMEGSEDGEHVDVAMRGSSGVVVSHGPELLKVPEEEDLGTTVGGGRRRRDAAAEGVESTDGISIAGDGRQCRITMKPTVGREADGGIGHGDGEGWDELGGNGRNGRRVTRRTDAAGASKQREILIL